MLWGGVACLRRWGGSRGGSAIDTSLPSERMWRRHEGRLTRLTADSREVTAGSAFIAMTGQTTDGHRYIPEAVRNGALVVFYEAGRELGLDPVQHPDVSFVPVVDTRAFGRHIAPAFYDFPSRRMKVTAITGTNGKSTCSLLLDGLARGLGKQTGLVNTFGIRYAGSSFRLANMVPEPVRLQTLLFDMADAGVDTLILEVTSQALAAGRLNGIDLDAAILTNVTRDHLDAHGTMEAYLEAKLRLFDLLAESAKSRRVASLWRDCQGYPSVVERLAGRDVETIVHALGPADAEVLGPEAGDTRAAPAATAGLLWADDAHAAAAAAPASGSSAGLLWAGDVVLDPRGTDFVLYWEGERLRCRTSLLGRFNVLNILAVLGSEPGFLEAVFSGDADCRRVLERVLLETRVPGRLEPVANDLGATILIDYAHTEDGLAQVLTSLRALPHRRIYTVFGCGGDRDRGKRPRMGAVAAALSDLVFLTTDNPRSEEPRAIIADIEAGMAGGCPYLVVEERGRAITAAIDLLQEGDILLVAGKGHEETQIVGSESLPFSDREVILDHLASKGWGGS